MSTSGIFTGTSQFSQDFQNVVTRAVNIASLPLTLLNADVVDLESQANALSGLDAKFAALQNAVSGIGGALSGAKLECEVSNPDVAAVTASSGASEAIYSLEVTDIGAYSTTLTRSWVATGQPRTYQLYVGTDKYEITPADNKAATVAAAINAKAGDKVRASAVNVGSATSPDYRISLQSTALGDELLDIKDGGASLQERQTAGWEANYIVNGSGKTVSGHSRTVAIASGVTVQLLSADPGHPVSITLTRSTSALSDALSAFTTAYNDAVDALDAQQGESQGALQGQALVRQVRSALSDMAIYSASGSAVTGLASLGLDLLKTGKIKFNPFQLMTADISNSAAVNSFLGSASGGGFLKAAIAALDGIENPVTGLLKSAETAVKAQTDDTNARIAAKQAQIDQLQQRLIEQMAAADAAISAMEQQYSFITSMFQAMQTADRGYN